MKYLSPRTKARRAALANRRWRKAIDRKYRIGINRVSERDYYETKNQIIKAPRIFSFSRNYKETVEFLKEMKDATLLRPYSPRRSTSIDLVPIESMSIAAAFVLAAEVQRWSEVVGKGLKPRDLAKWSPDVRRVLNGLGFFDLLGINRPSEDVTLDESTVAIFPIRSGKGMDPKAIADALEVIAATVDVFVQKPRVYEAMAEAVSNAISHAYPSNSDLKDQKRYPNPVSKWWLATCLDHENEKIIVFVYDQGVGIPTTLPKSKVWSGVRRELQKLFTGSTYTNAELIRAAVETRKTSTEQSNRGRGLPELIRVADEAGGGGVRIFSGSGAIEYIPEQGIGMMDHTSHIGGTLLEWTVPCLSGYHPHPLYVVCLLGLQARAGAGALRRRSG